MPRAKQSKQPANSAGGVSAYGQSLQPRVPDYDFGGENLKGLDAPMDFQNFDSSGMDFSMVDGML